MKRVKVETIFHLSDSADESVFADRVVEYMRHFVDPERGRNDKQPHYEQCVVSVERKSWENISE